MVDEQKERHYLNVPFNEKELVKSYGARWNPVRKQWYTVDYLLDCPDFARWLKYDTDYSLFANCVYLAESYRQCWKCKSPTKVYAALFNEYEYLSDSSDYIELGGKEVFVNGWIYEKEPFFINLRYLHHEVVYKLGLFNDNIINKFISVAKRIEGQQYCEHCLAKQGNYYLFDEVDSPFTFINPEILKNVNLHKVHIITKADGYPSYSYTNYINKEKFMKDSVISNFY
ncbi:DUF5710 domain-containing protein [Pseudogracilibacillus sp. SO30301A]|uniref:DUF5710 domain-containing protein n=1 Tax=Pseudogracilibacillus sp. SO30301A TaxID=3098291 RepID=UPI00300E0CB3